MEAHQGYPPLKLQNIPQPAQGLKQMKAPQPPGQLASPTDRDSYLGAHVFACAFCSQSPIGDKSVDTKSVSTRFAGQPITAVLLGGSITAGTGLTALENSWGSRFFHWVQATFPHQQHRLVNEAMPAVSSAYIAPCVEALVPGNTDLVIMEFSFNDYERANSFEFDDISRCACTDPLHRCTAQQDYSEQCKPLTGSVSTLCCQHCVEYLAQVLTAFSILDGL